MLFVMLGPSKSQAVTNTNSIFKAPLTTFQHYFIDTSSHFLSGKVCPGTPSLQVA